MHGQRYEVHRRIAEIALAAIGRKVATRDARSDQRSRDVEPRLLHTRQPAYGRSRERHEVSELQGMAGQKSEQPLEHPVKDSELRLLCALAPLSDDGGKM